MSDIYLDKNFMFRNKLGTLLSDEVYNNAVTRSSFNNTTLYNRLSELYGDTLSSIGLNVNDPVKAKMLYYDKFQSYGVLDPDNLGKSFIFFSRPELHFSAENILSSPILEYYYNTEMGRMLMSMLSDPYDQIGVYENKMGRVANIEDARQKLYVLLNRLLELEKIIDAKMNGQQISDLKAAGVDVEDLLGGYKIDSYLDNLEDELKQENLDEASIIEISSSLEDELMVATDEIVKKCWESPDAMYNAYKYYFNNNTDNYELTDEDYKRIAVSNLVTSTYTYDSREIDPKKMTAVDNYLTVRKKIEEAQQAAEIKKHKEYEALIKANGEKAKDISQDIAYGAYAAAGTVALSGGGIVVSGAIAGTAALVQNFADDVVRWGTKVYTGYDSDIANSTVDWTTWVGDVVDDYEDLVIPNDVSELEKQQLEKAYNAVVKSTRDSMAGKYTTAEERIKVLRDYVEHVYNVTDSILRHDVDEFGIFEAGTSTLAKDVFRVYNTYTGKSENANYTTPFIPLLSNTCKTCSGFNGFSLDTYEYETDFFGNSVIVPTGMDSVFGSSQFTASFDDVYGGPVKALFTIWVDYIHRVSRGYLNPKLENILNHVLDYTTSVYIFVTDRDNSTIRFFGKATGCFPVNVPLDEYITFSREIDSEQYKSVDISFKSNRWEPMSIEVLADFNFLSMQEFAIRPGINYENIFGNAKAHDLGNTEIINTGIKSIDALNSTSNLKGVYSWKEVPIDEMGLSGKVPYPSVPGSFVSNELRTSDVSNDCWGGYPYIKDLTKLIWVSPGTNSGDLKYRNLFN